MAIEAGAAGLRVVSVPHMRACARICDDTVQACLDAGVPVVRIEASPALAASTLRRLADAGTPALGAACTTLERWAMGRWSLFGDGRTPVTAAERRAAATVALDEAPSDTLATALPGMVGCMESALRTASGSPFFERADGQSPQLSPAQRELLAACRSYRRILTGAGLVEPGEAMAALPTAMGAGGWAHLVLVAPRQLTDAETTLVAAAAGQRGVTFAAPLGDNPACEANRALAERLEQACRDRGIPVTHETSEDDPREPWASGEVADLAERLFRAGSAPALAAQGDVGFCLPAGRYAEPELVARTLTGIVDSGVAPRAIAVACKDPLALADAVAPRLAEGPARATACRAQGSVPVAATELGRLLAALLALVQAERDGGRAPAPESLKATASDAARNPLARLTAQEAVDLDRAWRGNRSTCAPDMLRDLAAAGGQEAPGGQGDGAATSPLAAALAALREGDLAAAAQGLVEPLAGDGVLARRERAAAAAVARLARARRALRPAEQPSPESLARLVSGVAVPVSWVSVAAGDVAAQTAAAVLDANPNAVSFCTLADLEGRSYEAVLVCDLTAEDAPVGERDDACAVFLDALGVSRGTRPLQSLRRQLRGAVEAARSRICFERCLQDCEAQAIRPSALFEEIVDCYRADPTAVDDLDRSTGLPKNGRLPSSTLGEEKFSRLASPATWTPATVPVSAPGVALRPETARGQFFSDDRVWTPSALEAYLDCPLRWFYERQLPNEGIDASMGPHELGRLSRRTLRVFHERMARQGTPRVEGARDRASWQPVLDASFEQALDELACGADPLVAVTNLERERLEGVRRDLRACVERDALLPPGFVPCRHDLVVGDGEPLLFGSVRLRGTLDRVDEDGAGRALVIGYRGAIGDGYDVPRAKRGQDPSAVDPLPRHCQALIGAAALQRARPGTVVAGALYVSYNRARAKGFLDATVIPTDGPYLGPSNAVEPTAAGESGFQALLAYVEREVACAMDRLRDGDVAPRPRFGKDSCAYCSVTGCPKRRS